MGSPPAATGTQSVDRASDLVARVVRAGAPVAFGDLAEASGLARSTTSRLLAALKRSDLLARDDDGGWVAGALFDVYATQRTTDEVLVDANAALHREVQRIAGNATAARILDTLKSHLLRLQYRVILLPGRPQTSLAEHRAIVDAICKGDGDAAEAAMRRHLTSFTRLLKQAIDAVRHGGI